VRSVPYAPGLLFDHPAAPVPRVRAGVVVPDLRGTMPITSLGTRIRLDLAVQLVAYVASSAEADVWPLAWAVRRARALKTRRGYRAVAAAFPVQMAPVQRGLGGGEAAAATMRRGVERAILTATGVDPVAGLDQEGFFLDGHLRRLLESLGDAASRWTDRALWAYQWPHPDLPEGPGDVRCVAVDDDEIARRLAAGVWASGPARGLTVVLEDASERSFRPPDDVEAGVVVAVGSHGVEDLETMESWALDQGCSVLAIGRFPAGWDPPGPKRAASDTGQGVIVVGPSAEEARREILVRGVLAFDPTSTVDGSALSEACARRAHGEHSSAFRRISAGDAGLEIVAGLRPEGVPEGFLLERSGATTRDVVRAVAEGRLVSDGERWRLPQPRLLECNPMHADVVPLFDTGDPRRLLHACLGGEPVDDLVRWADAAMENLRSADVVTLLGGVLPGALGEAVTERLISAQLAELEPGGARRLISSLEPERARLFAAWLGCVDAGADGVPLPDDPESLLDAQPRIAAEVAVAAARQPDHRTSSIALLERAVERLSGPLGAWYRVEVAALRDPESLEQPAVRRRIADGQAWIRCRILHRRAQRRSARGRVSAARRAFRFLLTQVRGPGRRGMLELDLASASSDDPATEGSLLLRALRHLEAAGFRRRTHRVHFNLAMVDLERWRPDRAAERLGQVVSAGDPEGEAALAQLALTRGRIEEARRRIDEAQGAGIAGHLEDDWKTFDGMTALFEGRFETAERVLAAAGAEGEAWRRVAVAVRTGRVIEGPAPRNPWPTRRLETLVAAVVGGSSDTALEVGGEMDLETALVTAVAGRVLGDRWRPPVAEAAASAELLERAGLTGWATVVAPRAAVAGDVAAGLLAHLVEGSSVRDVDDDRWLELLAGVGLSGLEVRASSDDRVLWSAGSGAPGRAQSVPGGRLTPLGGDPPDSGLWRLLVAVVSRRLPDAATAVAVSPSATGIIGRCDAIATVNETIVRLAPAAIPVLVSGETGTGKELAARALHRLSGRSGRFIAVNVAEISGTLFESELFGAVKGAFTGADRTRTGLVEAADGGTLFLDEIGELELPYQVKLLRFMDNGEIRAVGSDHTRPVRVRVVMATHRNVESMVDKGSFRLDLWHRIRGDIVALPPLRERGDDILGLRDVFVERAISEQGLRRARWAPDADRALLEHRWPGNVRELRQVVETALVHAEGGRVTAADLPFGRRDTGPVTVTRWDQAHAEFRRSLITRALEASGDNRSGAARLLGLTRQTLLYHIRKLGIR
jgi:two-component system NtrC family response regulator